MHDTDFTIQTARSLAESTRGQATQIGLILAIGTMFSLLLVAQVTLAPQVQERTELRHSDTVLADMQEIQADGSTVAAGGRGQASVLRMGDHYPTYLVLAQPNGPFGTLRTDDAGSVAVVGARAVNDHTADYFDGHTVARTTTALEYEPGYYQYDAPTTRIANGVVTEQYDTASQVVASAGVVDGRRLSLAWTTGNINLGQSRPLTLRTAPLSVGDDAVAVRSASDESHLRLRFETSISTTRWRELLAGEIDSDTTPSSPSSDGDTRYIAGVEKTDGTLTIHLEAGVRYRLNMARLGWRTGSQPSFADVTEPVTAYLTTSDASPAVAEGTTTTLTARVADSYANPQPDVPVEAAVLDDGRLTDGAVTVERLSDGDGRVAIEYTAPEIADAPDDTAERTERVRVRLADSDATADGDPAVIVFDVRVQNSHA